MAKNKKKNSSNLHIIPTNCDYLSNKTPSDLCLWLFGKLQFSIGESFILRKCLRWGDSTALQEIEKFRKRNCTGQIQNWK